MTIEPVYNNYTKIGLRIFAGLILVTGALIVSLPLAFWDFLITYQFRPTVRPLYPLFYGSILVAGILVMVIGVLGFLPRFLGKVTSDRKRRFRLVLPILSAAFGIILPIVLGSLYATTVYLAADALFQLLTLGLVLGVVLSIVLLFAGGQAIYHIAKKRPTQKIIHVATLIPVILLAMGGTVVGVIMGPPDAECQPYPEDLPFVTPVYWQGMAGYHTFKIPTMITTPNGTILAFAEARVSNQEDWGKMDIVLRKSYDGGSTWTPMGVVVTEDDFTFGNTCPVVDQSTGFVWITFCKENDQCFVMHSEDNGETWTTPIDITESVKLDGWTWYATGPTHGIQLSDGTLVIPADHVVDRLMHAHVIFSRDHGFTWELGGSFAGGEEATLVELDNGDLYINVRPVRPGYRVTAISHDKGLSWTDISFDKALPDPACQGNLIKMDDPDAPGESIYLFSNAADSYHREKMTVRVSYDECESWAYSKLLYSGMASYSDLSLIDPTTNTIGCLFERGCNYYAEEIVFARFPFEYVLS